MSIPISIILMQPLYSGNLGSVARAMKNMELSDLRLVAPQADREAQEALNMAVGAKDVLRGAQVYENLNDAVADLQHLYGTSRRKRRHLKNFLHPRQLGERLGAIDVGEKLGILFGPEDAGLDNESLDQCHAILEIPTNPNFASMNLAASVAVIGYELHELNIKFRPQKTTLAPVEALDQMFEDWRATLDGIGFFPADDADLKMRQFRSLLHRARPNKKEVQMLRGICRQIRWAQKTGGQGSSD